jgi:hypothetical protein
LNTTTHRSASNKSLSGCFSKTFVPRLSKSEVAEHLLLRRLWKLFQRAFLQGSGDDGFELRKSRLLRCLSATSGERSLDVFQAELLGNFSTKSAKRGGPDTACGSVSGLLPIQQPVGRLLADVLRSGACANNTFANSTSHNRGGRTGCPRCKLRPELFYAIQGCL